MKPVYLVKPSMAYRDAYLAFYEEWSRSGEPMISWVITKDPSDFEGMVQYHGGIQDTSFVEENGNVVLRFWISL
ncbi:hypothetical protein AAC03nite_38630 [Alicyclobacillus acidoterrestris]|uniref:hypothetical protein n=1 Tax=Alicyclobacillus suci TaxID=2816080 RepID=UPI00118F7CFC|nr:hypothetical protein AAC03nite_38630 [Alicyclobacillus acidoterrestris]